MQIRPEQSHDHQPIHSLNTAAFDNPAEANLVDTLRQNASPIISLIAEITAELDIESDAESKPNIVGHIMFSPVTLSGHPNLIIMGLAPMAVAPTHQRQGIGTALVHSGLDHCLKLNVDALVVLGHSAYYPRFGFKPASHFRLTSEYDVPDEVFMAIELTPNALSEKTGTIKYHPAFAQM